ncbi:MAG: hypothetical protein K5768_05885 [Firmicutes bacterium]|nr:hypothetical protein [Bacillota bacterium]
MNIDSTTLAATAAIQRQLAERSRQTQTMVNAAAIQEGSTAECVALYLYEEILKYQANLPELDDVALQVVHFNQTTLIFVESIGYIGYNMVCFRGTDSQGKPMELIQHIHQLNFLLTVVPKPIPEQPKRKIGFICPDEEK